MRKSQGKKGPWTRGQQEGDQSFRSPKGWGERNRLRDWPGFVGAKGIESLCLVVW